MIRYALRIISTLAFVLVTSFVLTPSAGADPTDLDPGTYEGTAKATKLVSQTLQYDTCDEGSAVFDATITIAHEGRGALGVFLGDTRSDDQFSRQEIQVDESTSQTTLESIKVYTYRQDTQVILKALGGGSKQILNENLGMIPAEQCGNSVEPPKALTTQPETKSNSGLDIPPYALVTIGLVALLLILGRMSKNR